MTYTPPSLSLPASMYVERAGFERERKAVFWRSWQLVGSNQSLIGPGDYISTNVAGARVFVIRDQEGQLRGFRNICRHRGAPLLEPGIGNTHAIRCPYHNWVYRLDGQLDRAPHFGDSDALEAGLWGLSTVQVQVWQGMIFVAIDAPEPLETQLGATVAELSTERMETMTLVATRRLEFDANWKLYTDNFVEGYHIPGIHPEFFKAIDFSRFEATALDGLVRMTAPTASDLFYRGRWLWMWPNWTLSLYPGGLNTSRINPLSESRTELLYHFYFQDGSPEARAAQLETVEKNMGVIREDFSICEQIQSNFEAEGYEPGPLSPRHEQGVAYFQERLKRTLSASAPED